MIFPFVSYKGVFITPNYFKRYTMDVENELRAIRYLINDLILYVYDMRVRLDEIVPAKRKYKMNSEPNANGDSIRFDLFSIKKERYNELIAHYGVDVVNQACVKLDKFIKLNEYIPYRNPYMSLNRRFIKEVLHDRLKQNERASI